MKVEQELSRQSASAYQPVSEITSYLLGGGGKRLRPALLLLAHGYAAGSEGDARSAKISLMAHGGLKAGARRGGGNGKNSARGGFRNELRNLDQAKTEHKHRMRRHPAPAS